MKILGFVTFAIVGLGAASYFGGFASGSAEVELTNKGRDTLNQGIGAAQDGLNSGLNRLKIEADKEVSFGD